jgi:hypothetical protein
VNTASNHASGETKMTTQDRVVANFIASVALVALTLGLPLAGQVARVLVAELASIAPTSTVAR